MFKQLLVVSAVLVTSTTVAFAAQSYKGEMAPCPTYVYASGPYLGLSAGVRNNYTSSPFVYKGLEGTVSGGWGIMLNPSWYLAGEIFAGTSTNLKNYTHDGVGVKSSWSYGIDIIPGFMITDYVLTYLRAGISNTRFTNQSTNKSGWHVGLGGQTNITGNWDLRGEYIYTQYSNVSGIGKPQADQFNLGIVYKLF